MNPPRLYPILDASFERAWPAAAAVRALGRAGCTWVQLRAKELSSRAFYDWALEAVEEGRRAGVVVLVNDRADVALLAGAAGVHLGQEDLSPEAARKILGAKAVIGLSTHTREEFHRAQASDVDYVAVGPVFGTRTKPTERVPVGLLGVSQRKASAQKAVVAIGGITRENARSVLDAGADSVAVISALMEASDLEAAARELVRILTDSRADPY